jgi:hypothetical protein
VGAAGVVAGAALAIFVVSTLAAVSRNVAFGFDEAVYVQLAAHWVDGAPASGWDLHRPPGLSILASLPLLAGVEAEWAFRLFGVLAGVGVLVGAGALARLGGGRVAAAIAVVALAAAAPVQVESASFLTDVPATAALLAAGLLAWRWGRSGGGARVLPWVAVASAAAFHLRYGAIVGIGAILLAVAVVFPAAVRSRARDVAASVALLLVALAPHLVLATLETGVPWGLLARARSAADDGTLPALAYLAWFPWQLAGPLAALVALAGIADIVRVAVRPGGRRVGTDAFARFVGIVVAPQLLVLGLLVHGEPRYAVAPMAFLVVAGAVALAERVREAPVRRRTMAVAGTAVGALALVVGVALAHAEVARRDAAYGWTREVGRAVGADASGSTCSVLTSDVPIISRYSGCEAFTLVGGAPAERLALLSGRRYVVVRTDGLHVPSAPALAELLGAAVPWRTFADGSGTVAATVYRLPAR